MSTNRECCVCFDDDIAENQILTCNNCKIQVHLYCYGATEGTDNWLCSPCQVGLTNIATCQLCISKGGAMKRTTCKGWVHVICSLFTDGVEFTDVEKMEPVDISKVSSTKRNQLCCFCSKCEGYCNLCAKTKCTQRLHVTCAQMEKCLEEKHKASGTISFRAYCKDHKPKKPNRRVSIKGLLDKKRKKPSKQTNAKANADWIYQAAASQDIESHPSMSKHT